MKTIIAGSRQITNYQTLLNALKENPFPITEVVSGHAKGVDTLGEQYGKTNNIPVIIFPANWGQFGKQAGIMRNLQMAEYAEALIAIWDGTSKGTKHMIDVAKRKGLKVYIYRALA
jgi:hypothetical protein